MDTTEIKFEDVVALLDKEYDLVYVDYRDNLDDNLKEIQEAIQKQSWEPLDNCINDGWLWECESYSVDYILKELADDMARAFDIEEEDAEEWIEENRDDLRDEIYKRDRSDPLGDLLRNTSDPVAFYDTGTYIEESWHDGELGKEMFRTVKRALGIKMRDKTWDREIWSLLANASYGGRLVIYFRMPIEDLMKLKGMNVVTFHNPIVAIIDTYNGSGDHDHLPGLTVKLPLDTTNIFLDKTFKYSYVYSVCGLIESFADVTNVQFFKNTRSKRKACRSTLHDELDLEAKYNAVFNAGGCTTGDMDIRRHRDTFYLNEFPCGTHCPHCGTFWID